MAIERAPRLGKLHGDGAGGIVGHDRFLDGFASGDRGRPGRGDQRFLIVGDGAGVIDQQGDVIDADAKERFGEHPLRGSITALQQAALERVGHIGGGQVIAVVESTPWRMLKV